MRHIIKQPSTLEQRDRQRKTPLQVTRRRGHHDIEKLLLEAGAVDLGAAIPPRKAAAGDDSSAGRSTKGQTHAECMPLAGISRCGQDMRSGEGGAAGAFYVPPRQVMPPPTAPEEDLAWKKTQQEPNWCAKNLLIAGLPLASVYCKRCDIVQLTFDSLSICVGAATGRPNSSRKALRLTTLQPRKI